MRESTLEHALQHCSLHSLLMITSKVLSREGFGDVQILDRRTSREKSRFGGHELLCQTSVGSLPIKVIVKVIRDSVRLRMLDELAGAVDRTRADLGLIVTPFGIGSLDKSLSKHHRARLEVIDGKWLSERLEKYQIGTRGKNEVDYAFFGGIEEQSKRILAFIAEGRL